MSTIWSKFALFNLYDKNTAVRSNPSDPSPAGRPTCYSCFRPASYCVCGFVEPFEAHCNIVILQHPHERRKYYSTAKIVKNAIINSRLLRGIEFTSGEIENALDGRQGYLLFPGEHAADAESVTLDANSTVIAVDGTWREACKILFRNPALKDLPSISFAKPLRSAYRIRKQPKDNYLSTLESIGHLLRLNAEASGKLDRIARYDSLFAGFERMIDQQLQHFPRFQGPHPELSPTHRKRL